MKKIFKLTDRVFIGEYTIEYSNFNVLIKKNNKLVKCIDKDFNDVSYSKFIEKFMVYYNNRT